MADKRPDSVKNGDRAAFEELLSSYEVLIRAECSAILSKFPDFKSEEEEMRQEGRLALYNAAMKYEQSEQVTFGLFAKICIHNRLISYIRKLSSAKRRRDRLAEKAMASAENGKSAEEFAIAIENSDKLRELLDGQVSAYEKRVFALYLEKKSYEQISAIVGRDIKSVANAICRVKAKLKSRLKQSDNA